MGYKNVASVLLFLRAGINATDEYDCTPLHLAAQNDNLNVAQLLIDSGADKEARDHDGRTPQHWAA